MVAPTAAEHPFQFTSHPPERGRSETSEPACAGACCSCCCCCLHTMGGLVGALAYSLRDPSRRDALNQEELDFQEEFDRGDADAIARVAPSSGKGLSVTVIYWLSLLILTVIGSLGGILIWMPENNNGRGFENVLFGTGLVLLMVLPGVQFLAVGVSLVIVGFGGGRGESGAKFSQLARITIGTTVGAFVGLLIMVAACGGLILIR
jgi:hypothetical protein